MTFLTPPYAMDGTTQSAQNFRQAIGSLMTPGGGIVDAGDLQLQQNGTANMSVNVMAGRAWVPGTTMATVANPSGGMWYPQGPYFTENDAAVNVPIAAASPSNPRIDTIIVQVIDEAFAESAQTVAAACVTGTATGGATLTNLSGAGTVPASSLVIGYVLVPANATSIVAANLKTVVSKVGLLADRWNVRLNSSGNIAANDGDVIYNTSAGSLVVLPAATPGAEIIVISNATTTAIGTGGVSTIVLTNGSATTNLLNLALNQRVYFVAANGNWWIVGGWGPASSGTSFPTANLGDECFRTDLDTWYKYDGSAWWPMLIPGAWSTVPSSGGYFYGWSGTVRARREGDVVRLSGQLTNSGASGSDGSTCFVLPFPAPTQTTKWFTQVSANANPVLFSIASGEYGTTVEIDPYSEDTFASSGFVSFEGCTYTIS
jgi:hypothetical protein